MDSIRRRIELASCLVMLSLSSIAAEPSSLTVQLEFPADKAVVSEEEGRTIVTVTSATGIGRMTLSAKDRWPKEITLRLRYAHGKPFKTLEGFDVTSSRLQIRSNSSESKKARFFLADDDGKFCRDDVIPSGWLNLEYKPHGDDLDVIFPASLWRGEKEVRFQWIDFYRV